MRISLPGFPAPLTDPIELPDIGELLMYPPFQNIGADEFNKHATDFQRYLFERIPLRNDRKHVIVRSGVWLLEPGSRSHVALDGDWHIDGNSDFDHLKPDERIFILSSPCSALTEFNLHPLTIDSTPQETRRELTSRIRESPERYGVVARPIEPRRIYMFENHLHRAVNPKRIEFRFFLRVRETNADAVRKYEPLTNIVLTDSTNGERRQHMEYRRDHIRIYYPRARGQSAWAPA
jgi:hypothetical protein